MIDPEATLAALVGRARDNTRVLVVAAHPDDETIGAGVSLSYFADVHVRHLTDGAPRDPALYPREARGLSREQYARERAAEVRRVLSQVGIGPERIASFGVPDQEAPLYLEPLVERLLAELTSLEPEVVISHPYEGGHPDHDAAAFCVQMTLARARARGRCVPLRVEMTSYHARGGAFITGELLGHEGIRVHTRRLDDAERSLKRRLLDGFVTQRETLAPFRTDVERFRLAPEYDFAAPPHDSPLYYEGKRWPMTGARFCELAVRAARSILGGS